VVNLGKFCHYLAEIGKVFILPPFSRSMGKQKDFVEWFKGLDWQTQDAVLHELMKIRGVIE